jgi:hypothetical protein
MIIQYIEVKELFEEFNEVIAKAEDIVIFSRDIELQKKEREVLAKFIEKSEKLKNENKYRFSEPELNLILCLIISADTIKTELSMIICLKNGEMDAAWACLIQAQNLISIVACNHPISDGKYLNRYRSKLDSFEKLLFPRMMFASAGGIIKKTRCSICGLEYEDCEHLKGKMYFGELCVREIHEIDLEEVSMVENPASKLCRQLTTYRNGKTVDVLTLLEKTNGNNVKKC